MVEAIVAVLGAAAAIGLALAVIGWQRVEVLKRERAAERGRREGTREAIARFIRLEGD